MTTRVIGPATRPPRGQLRLPGDKSISHRALLLNALGEGTATIRGLLRSEDTEASAAALRACGVRIDDEGPVVRVHGTGRLEEPGGVLDCGNSGTSIRLLAGVLAAQPFYTVLTGDDSLRSRPMGRVVEPLRKMGARIEGRAGGKLAPLGIRGGDLGRVDQDLSVASAQVKSALLLAGLRGGVSVREPAPSRDHTERMLVAMGARLERRDGWHVLAPTPGLRAVDVDVPSDLSAAAFFLVLAALIPGSEVLLEGVGVNPTRTGILDALALMGADIEVRPVERAGAEPVADLLVRGRALHGARIAGDLALRALDELPVLSVAAAFATGTTVIADAAELRVKESDRLARMAAGLRALGVDLDEHPDGMTIRGGRPRGPARVDATGDHRIAMSFAVAALAGAGPVEILGADAVSSSFPGYFDALERLSPW